MLSRLDPLDMPRLDVLDEEFGEDAAASLHARRRRIGSDGKRMEIHALIKLTPTQIRPLRNSNPASGSQIRLMRTWNMTLDRVAQVAERKYCGPHARPFRLGFPRKVPVSPICAPAAR